MSFVFNRDYHDLNQVAQWLPKFSAIYAEITQAGAYTYNDSFKGRISGIAGEREDTAIYLLQKLYRARENAERIAAALRDGCEPIDHIDRVTKFARVIVYDDQDRMRGPIWQEWQDARLVPDASGYIRAILPKGKRNHGYLVNKRKVMVMR